MSRDQRQIDKIREDIERVTKMMADPNRSSQVVKMLEARRQKYHSALKILSKGKK